MIRLGLYILERIPWVTPSQHTTSGGACFIIRDEPGLLA